MPDHERCRRSARQKAIQDDQHLLQQCLAGEPAAWENLYKSHHNGLIHAIVKLLPSQFRNIDVLDEIAARVWFALIRDRASLLRRFDPNRGHRLADFLAGVARMVARQYLRCERRRRRREIAGARKLTCRQSTSESELAAIVDEFNSALTAGELSFLNNVLLPGASRQQGENLSHPEAKYSKANYWQRRHRLRARLQRFLFDNQE